MGNINSSKLTTLCTWPSDAEINLTIEHSYNLASDLADALDMSTTQYMNHLMIQPFVLIEKQNVEISAGIEPNSDEFFETDREISDAINQASKHASDATNDDIFNFLDNEDNTDDQIRQTQIISILNATKSYSYSEEQNRGIYILLIITILKMLY